MPHNLPIKIYTPESPLKRPGQFVRSLFDDIAQGRELGWRLAVRDIKAQYRQAALGIVWAFIMPLFNTITWIFLQGTGIVGLQETALPYPVYVFSGTILWAIFTEAFNAPLKVTTAAKGMLSKINFSREALLLSALLQTLFNSGIKVVIVLLAMVALGFYPTEYILLFPVALFSLVLAGTALGLLITPIGILYTDIGKAIPLLMQFMMYLTPVVFPLPDSGIAATLFRLNPLTPLITTARNWLTGFPAELLSGYIWVNIGMIALLILVWIVFKLVMPILIERMNA